MKLVLPVIVVSQFFCTSLWFAGNSVIGDLANTLHLEQSFIAHLTSAIQLGFITGTLLFAIFTISDRYSPSRVFFFSAILASLFNLGITLNGINGTQIIIFRFLTGCFLAGIYPVGMKLAADHYSTGLGKSLGFLVGALVLGTALPHLLKTFTWGLQWTVVMYTTSTLSLIGGTAILLLVPDGPYRKAGQAMQLSTFLKGFKNQGFRSVAFGYFGHMWELYTFWAFVPAILTAYNLQYPSVQLNVPLLAFLIIASGSVACIFSGLVSTKMGIKKNCSAGIRFIRLMLCSVSVGVVH